MMEHYKGAVGRIPVPPELIAKTASSMRLMQEKEEKAPRGLGLLSHAPNRRRFPIVAIPAAACVVLAVVLGVFLLRGGDRESDIFVTMFTGDRHIRSVELANGRIDFYDETENAPPPILSGPGVRREEWTQAEYLQYLGMEPAFEHLPSALVLCDESAVVCTAGDRVLWDYNTLRFESDNGGILEMTVSKGTLPPGMTMVAEENSNINGHALAAGFNRDNNTYWAQFVYDDVGYFIESKNLSQEEFIRILYGIFS